MGTFLFAPVLFESLINSATQCFTGLPGGLCHNLHGFGSAVLDITPVPHPEIKMDAATFVGTSYRSVDGFLGIPFAEPP